MRSKEAGALNVWYSTREPVVFYMAAWASFYSVVAGESATLMGLLFVTLSVAVGSELGLPHSSTRALAEQAFKKYLAILMIACLALFPDQNIGAIGGVCLAVIATKLLWSILRFSRSLRQGADEMPLLGTFGAMSYQSVGSA